MADAIPVGVNAPGLGDRWILLVTFFSVGMSVVHVASTSEYAWPPRLDLNREARYGGHGRQGVLVGEVANPNTLGG